MTKRIAAWLALAVVLLAPQAFSLHLLSFLHAKELVYALALVLLSVLAQRSAVGTTPPRWVYALLFWLTLEAALSLALGPHFRAPLEQWAHALVIVAFFLAAWDATESAGLGPWLPRAVWGSGALAALLGLLQFTHVIDAWLPVFPHYDQRMYSVFGNQDLLGGYLAITLPFVLAAILRGARPERGIAALSLVLILPALLLSASRSAWLAGGAASLIYLVFAAWPRRNSAPMPPPYARRARALLALFALGLACATPWWGPRALATFGEADTGGNLRLWFYAGTAHMIQDNPWLGVGLGRYGLHSPEHLGAVLRGPGGAGFARNELFTDHAHCDPLETLAEVGVLGLLLLLALLAWALRGARYQRGAAPALASGIALLVFALLNPTLHSAPHALIGLLCLRRAIDTTRHSGPPLGNLRLVHGFAPLLVALWLYTTLLPSATLARLEDTPKPPCDAMRDYEVLLARYQGPPQAYEGALCLAEECLKNNDSPALRNRIDHLYAIGTRLGDTASLHLAYARCMRDIGDAPRATAAYTAVLNRWPEHAEARAFVEASTQTTK